MTKIFESIEEYECISCERKENENSALDGLLKLKKVFKDVYGKNKFICLKCCDEKRLLSENEQYEKANYIEQYRGVGALLSQLILSGLSKTDIHIYQYLWFKKGENKNIIFDINQVELSKILGIQKTNISRSIKKLIDSDILEKVSSKQFRFTIYKELYDEGEFK